MKYRSRADIIAEILKAANGGNTKTRLMYGAFLSFAQISEYMVFLLDKELIQCVSGSLPVVKYALTEKGLTFLNVYAELQKLIGKTD